MKKIIPAGIISVIAAPFFLPNAPSAFSKPQKKPAGSSHENVDAIGEKPAARTVAVGAKLIRDADGSVDYAW